MESSGLARDTEPAMSEATVEVVRRFNDPYEGQDLMVLIRGAVADFGANPDQATVLSWWQQDPSWRHVLSDAEWDTTAIPGVGTKVSGAVEVARWWGDWTDAWESYSSGPVSTAISVTVC